MVTWLKNGAFFGLLTTLGPSGSFLGLTWSCLGARMSKRSASACHRAHFWVLLGGPFVALGPHNPANGAFWEVFFQDVFSALFFEAEGLPLQWSDVAHMLYIVYGLHIAPF